MFKVYCRLVMLILFIAFGYIISTQPAIFGEDIMNFNLDVAYSDCFAPHVMDGTNFKTLKCDHNSLLIGLQNIRSCNRNLENFILEIGEMDHVPEVLMLTETWSNYSDVGNVKCYDSFISSSNYNRASGVAALVKCSLKGYPVSINNGLNCTALDSIFIKIDKSNGFLHDIVLGNFYRSSAGSIWEFLKYLESLLPFICSLYKNIIIMGDFNLDVGDEGDAYIRSFKKYSPYEWV